MPKLHTERGEYGLTTSVGNVHSGYANMVRGHPFVHLPAGPREMCEKKRTKTCSDYQVCGDVSQRLSLEGVFQTTGWCPTTQLTQTQEPPPSPKKE